MKGKNSDINVEDYVNLVRSIASRYSSYGSAYEDLFQEGMIGLLEAKERFDENRGTSFAAYASFWVKKRIINTLERERKQSMSAVSFEDSIYSEESEALLTEPAAEKSEDDNTIALPEDFPLLEKQILTLLFQEGKTLNEIAELLGLNREKVRQIKQKALRRLKLTKG